MIASLFAEHAGWAWLTLGFVLLAMELAIPGVLLMWVGFAAAAVGAITLFGPSGVGISSLVWSWKAQVLTFAALSVMFAVIGSRVTQRGDDGEDAASALNRPGQRLVGRSGPLVDAIDGGVGRVRLGDTIWRVQGPDMPAGSRVRVVGANDETLVVEPETVASASVPSTG